MRYISLIVIVVFGTSFLLLRFLLSFAKTDESNFFTKGVKTLAAQTLLYFFCLAILEILYTFGALDSVQLNFEYLIAALAMIGVAWVIFGIIILGFSVLITSKWNKLEVDCKDSFSKC